MNQTEISIIVCVVVLLFGADIVTAGEEHIFQDVDVTSPLTLDFGSYRIRVDGWDYNYVKVSVEGRASTPLIATGDDNNIYFRAELFKQPLYEPAFRIKVPRSQPISIVAEKVWAKDCTIRDLSVKVAYVRDCAVLGFYPQMKPINPLFDWLTFRWRTDGWQAIRFDSNV